MLTKAQRIVVIWDSWDGETIEAKRRSWQADGASWFDKIGEYKLH